MSKIHVMHVIDSLSIGGAEWMLVSLVNSIDTNKYTPSVCVTRNGLTLAKEIRTDIPLKELQRRWSFDPRGFVRLRKFSQQQKVDLYHAHGRSTFLFLVTAKKLGFITAPVLLHDHFGIEINQNVPFWFRIFGSRNLDYYIGVYEKLANWAVKAGVPEDRVTSIGNALEMKRFQDYPALNLHQKFQVPPERKIGIVVGNLRPAKGLDLLIESLAKCKFDISPLIIVVGKVTDKEYYQKCFDLIKSAGLEDSFKFVGQQENSISWMKGADFGIMPSRSESGPLVLIEMMGCGLPVAAFNVGNISKAASKELPDNFAQPEDTKEFAKLLQEMAVSSKEILDERGSCAKKVAYQLFDIKKKLPQWYVIYNNVVERNV